MVKLGKETHAMCGECHASHPARQKEKEKAAENAERFRQLVRSVGKVSAATISDLAIELEQELGSMKEFAKFYVGQLKIAATKQGGPGSSAVLNACAGIAKIVAASTVYQATMPEVARMTDEQLADEWKRGLIEVVRHLPLGEIENLLQTEEGRDERLLEHTG